MSAGRDAGRLAAGVAVRVIGFKWIAIATVVGFFVGIIGLMVIGGAASEPPRDSQTVNCEGSWTGVSPAERNLSEAQRHPWWRRRRRLTPAAAKSTSR